MGVILLGRLVVARRLVFDPARQLLGVSQRDIVQIVGHRPTFLQFCGVSNCIIPFPIAKSFCDTDCWQQCGDGSDGAAATGLGFLTAAAAVATAL